MKNRKALALGGLLMAVAVTAYSVSGTYAKYISKVGGTDTARVAKWSFNSGAEEIDLFKESYTTADGGVKFVQSLGCTGEGADKVCDDVVAPGTNGQYTFQLNNSDVTDVVSEVNYKVTMKIGGINKALVKVTDIYDQITAPNIIVIGGEYYYSPIQFAYDEGTTIADDATWGTLEDTLKLISDGIIGDFDFLTDATTKVETNNVVTTFVVNGSTLEEILADSYTSPRTIAWKWDYNDPSAAGLTDVQKSDAELASKYDTKIGNMAAKGDDTTVSLTVEFTFEQTQEAPTVVTP